MEAVYSIVEFFTTGGPFMVPILLVFAIGIAISFERYITLTIVTRKNRRIWDQVKPLLDKGDFGSGTSSRSSRSTSSPSVGHGAPGCGCA